MENPAFIQKGGKGRPYLWLMLDSKNSEPGVKKCEDFQSNNYL
jgi:hypothetical protein